MVLPSISFQYDKSWILRCICHVCGNNLKIKCYIRKHLQKQHRTIFGSKFEILTFQVFFLQNPKPQQKKQLSHSFQEILSFTALVTAELLLDDWFIPKGPKSKVSRRAVSILRISNWSLFLSSLSPSSLQQLQSPSVHWTIVLFLAARWRHVFVILTVLLEYI